MFPLSFERKRIIEMAQEVGLPNFIVIGAARAGTTWLAKNLMLHPEVFMSDKKELHFFDRDFNLGIDNYKTHFTQSDGYKAIGEATPAYLHTPQVAQRIHDSLGKVKLILSFRNPVDRLYSRYLNAKAKFAQNANISFEDKILQKPEFITEGYYIDHLQPYLNIFGRENIHVVFFDDIKDRGDEVMSDVYSFLGVDPEFKSPVSDVKINSAANKGALGKRKSVELLSKTLRKLKLYRLSYSMQNSNMAEVPKMDAALRKKLIQEHYRERNLKLADVLQVDLNHWNV